jgi:hypothetical protein
MYGINMDDAITTTPQRMSVMKPGSRIGVSVLVSV